MVEFETPFNIMVFRVNNRDSDVTPSLIFARGLKLNTGTVIKFVEAYGHSSSKMWPLEFSISANMTLHYDTNRKIISKLPYNSASSGPLRSDHLNSERSQRLYGNLDYYL